MSSPSIFFRLLQCKSINYFAILILLSFTISYSPAVAQSAAVLNKLKITGVPIIGYNNSTGLQIGTMGLGYFSLNKSDTISPPSNIGLGASITTNKTWFTVSFGKLYYKQDTWRTTYALGYGDSKFQFYNEGLGGNAGFIDYNTTAFFLYLEQLRKVYGRWYLGLSATYFQTSTKISVPGINDTLRNFVGIGIPLTFDSRDNVQYPKEGTFANIKLNEFSKALGSYSDYTKLELTLSQFREINSKGILGWNASIRAALGAVPFEAQTIVGGRIIRGYSNGKYRGDQVYSAQAEYRHMFAKRMGFVAFVGAATYINDGTNWDATAILPAAGAGFRYVVIPSIKANIGLDVAVGKADYGIYIRYAEAF